MYLGAEVVALRVACRHLCERLAVAEPDLEIDRVVVTEHRGKVQWRTCWRYAPAWPQRLEGPLLTRGQTPLAQHIAADGAMRTSGFVAQLGRVGARQIATQAS